MKKFLKFIYYSLFILFVLFGFSSCVKADSLNISDFDTEIFVSPLNGTNRTCDAYTNLNQNGTTFGIASNSCTYNFSVNEWNNNFLKNDYNFLIYPINHSAYQSVAGSSNGTNLQFIVDYTMKFYLKDVNNKIYICDIVNNSLAMCRYDRNVRIVSLNSELIFLGGTSNVSNSQIFSKLYYQSQYYLTSYKSVKDTMTNINDTINDSSIDTSSMGSSSSGWESKSASNGTITNLLTLPISFIQKFLTGFSGSCSTFTLGTIFDTTLTLPCINLKNVLGTALWSTIDVLISGLMIFAIGKKLVKIFNDFTNLKDNQINDLYGGGA